MRPLLLDVEAEEDAEERGRGCDFPKLPWALLSDKRQGMRKPGHSMGAGEQELGTLGLKLPGRLPLAWGPPCLEGGSGGAALPGLTLSEASLASGHETGSEMVEKSCYFPVDVEGIRLPSGPADRRGSPRKGEQGAGTD